MSTAAPDFSFAWDWVLAAARQAAEAGEVPIGAVLFQGTTLIARDRNRVEALQDPTAHAELLCISSACSHLQSRYLTDGLLMVSVEPCPMCAYAISLARIPRVTAALPEPKTGFSSRYGLSFGFDFSISEAAPQAELQQLMQRFFQRLRC